MPSWPRATTAPASPTRPWRSPAGPATGVPGPVLGLTRERVLHAPAAGALHALRRIGDPLQPGDAVAEVAGQPVTTPIGGVLRGLVHEGLAVCAGEKVGDVDPRGIAAYCTTLSDKARALGGAVLEAILYARTL